jgi:tRNA(adenine34) deaminase
MRNAEFGMQNDERWMREAICEAKRTRIIPHSTLRTPHSNDVPIGAVCVRDNQIIGRGHNRREAEGDPTAHAEVLALRDAAQTLGSWRLEGVTLYVTLEPCPMCAGALWLARVDRLVFGAWDEKAGACGSLFDIPRDPRLNHRLQVRGGVLEEECKTLLKEFFQQRRL